MIPHRIHSVCSLQFGHIGLTSTDEPGRIAARNALIKEKLAKPVDFWVSSSPRLAANLSGYPTIRLTTWSESVQGSDCAEPVPGTVTIPALASPATTAVRWRQLVREANPVLVKHSGASRCKHKPLRSGLRVTIQSE
jgi:hypothetical protein